MTTYKGKRLTDLGKKKLIELLDEQVKVNMSMQNHIKELYETIESSKQEKPRIITP